MTRKAALKRKASRLEQVDLAVAEAFAPVRDHGAVEAIGRVSDVGDQPPLYALCGGVIAAGLALGDARTLRAGARMLAAHVAAIWLKSALKKNVDRTRPDLIADEGRYERGGGDHDEHDYNSFPSGHTASSIAVARALGREYPGLHGGAVAAAATVSAIQVVRSKHFVTDIVAGAAVGLAAEAAVDAVFRRFHPDVA